MVARRAHTHTRTHGRGHGHHTGEGAEPRPPRRRTPRRPRSAAHGSGQRPGPRAERRAKPEVSRPNWLWADTTAAGIGPALRGAAGDRLAALVWTQTITLTRTIMSLRITSRQQLVIRIGHGEWHQELGGKGGKRSSSNGKRPGSKQHVHVGHGKGSALYVGHAGHTGPREAIVQYTVSGRHAHIPLNDRGALMNRI